MNEVSIQSLKYSLLCVPDLPALELIIYKGSMRCSDRITQLRSR